MGCAWGSTVIVLSSGKPSRWQDAVLVIGLVGQRQCHKGYRLQPTHSKVGL